MDSSSCDESPISDESSGEKSSFFDEFSEHKNTDDFINDNHDDNDDFIQDECGVGNIFQRKLRQWALLFHISLVALTALLLLLKSVINFPLPLDARTLMGTVRKVKISQMHKGEYHHFGLERAVRGILKEFSNQRKPINEVKLIFNIDGLPISRSGSEGLWLILCSEINGDAVYPVGAFYGKKKPNNANEFLKEFVDELTVLCNTGLEGLQISCAALVCDAPAKSFVLNLKGHTGYDSCPKCLIKGKYIPRKVKRKNGKDHKKKAKRGTVCFPGTKSHPLKTDEGFARNDYDNFDTGTETILKSIPNFGCISNVPLDYMHLILLGVMKKIIKLLVNGPLKIRLGAESLRKINKKLRTLRRSIPREFARKPRSIQYGR